MTTVIKHYTVTHGETAPWDDQMVTDILHCDFDPPTQTLDVWVTIEQFDDEEQP